MNDIPARGVWKNAAALAIFERMMADGRTGSETAGALNAAGFPVTRSAVIGRAKRLGLVVGTGKAPAPERNGGRIRHAPARALGAAFPVSVVRKRRKVGAAGLLLVDAEAGECRWPISGEGARLRVCGSCCPITAPYCAEHMGVAYDAGAAAAGRGNAWWLGGRG